MSSRSLYRSPSLSIARDRKCIRNRAKEDSTEISLVYWPSGVLAVEECIQNGRLNGIRKTWHRNGKLKSACMWIDGRAHGVKKTLTSKGGPESTSTYRYGVLDGPSVQFHPNGMIKEEIQWSKGIAKGVRSARFDSGEIQYIGHLCTTCPGNFCGPFKVFDKEGNVIEEKTIHGCITQTCFYGRDLPEHRRGVWS